MTLRPPVATASPKASEPSPEEGGDHTTGLPWFRTWPAVYIFVLLTFVLWVGLLAALTFLFS